MCAPLRDAVRDAEDANAQQRDTIWALERAVTDARRGEATAKAQAAKRHEEAAEARIIRQCLDVWVEYCWGGKGKKPNVSIDGARAARVREFLVLDFDADDICDAFRGLGLLPYEGQYGKRSATPQPGFARKAQVEHALRTIQTTGRKGCPDEARLERFRDYYRRVQATPAERLLEQWQDATAVANELFSLLLRAQGKEEAAEIVRGAERKGHLFVIEGGEGKAA